MTAIAGWRRAFAVGTLAVSASLARLLWAPLTGDNDYLKLVQLMDPSAYSVIAAWYYLMPAAAVALCVSGTLSFFHVWLGRDAKRHAGSLPAWPAGPNDETLRVVVGEVQHPVRREPSRSPTWLTLPAEGLYTGIAIFGAVGTGKTSACMYPFAEQILSWQAGDEKRKAGALVLEVKGDFCYKVQGILAKANRESDYVEIGIDEDRHMLQWNPLDADWVDPYSLAYQLASLINQLFGKGKDPFWPTAYTNLIRWIIELYRVDRGWLTLREVYRCAIQPELLAERIAEAEQYVREIERPLTLLPVAALAAHPVPLGANGLEWSPAPDAPHGDGYVATAASSELSGTVRELGLGAVARRGRLVPEREATRKREALGAVKAWYEHDWLALAVKLRTSIVESVSVFLGLFDEPQVRRIFCPERPPVPPDPERAGDRAMGVNVLRPLEPISQLIEEGKVITLNMPVGANPALARAVGVMLKQAWLQALLRRPSAAGNGDWRPSAFICDEYQNFATVGVTDPGGDEKSFSLTRQARCIPIIATQSISSIQSAVQDQVAARTLLQAFRTKLFLSLSDEHSAKIASEMCGQVIRTHAAVSFNESSGRAGLSLLSGRAGGARPTMGMSKSYSKRREALFHPRDFALLDVAEAIVLPFDGKRSHSATRVYLKPYYLPRDLPFFEARARGEL